MTEEAPPDDPLREFLSGKRQHSRTPLDMPVELRRGGTRLFGRTVDVSEGGVLVSITPECMEEVGCGPEEILAALVGAFCEGFEVRFNGLRLKAAAEMVRLSLPTGDEDGDFYLGCRFKRPLSGRQQRKLGLEKTTGATRS